MAYTEMHGLVFEFHSNVTHRGKQQLRHVAVAVGQWSERAFSGPLPFDWRAQYRAVLADQAAQGRRATPASAQALEDWFESFAQYCGLLPRGPVMEHHHRWRPQRQPIAQLAHGDGSQTVQNLSGGGFVIHVTPTVSGPPESQASAAQPKPVFIDGVEVAGPGPETTESFRAKVQIVLEMLDPAVARWWDSIRVQGIVRARDAAGWLTFWRFNYKSWMEGDRPVVVVDSRFTAADAAQAIVASARSGLWAGGVADAFTIDDAPLKDKKDKKDEAAKFQELREASFKEAAGTAAIVAEFYYSGFASITPGGQLVLTLNDVAENGLTWRQAVASLPLFFTRGGIKSLLILIPIKGSRKARGIRVPDALVKDFAALNPEDQLAIAKEAAAAGKDDVAKTIELGIQRRRTTARPQPKSPEATPTPKALSGKWIAKIENMSARARAYQTQITGRNGEVYRYNGVEFDGVGNGVLLEAKGPGYSTFIEGSTFKKWFKNESKLLRQAADQSRAAGGLRLEWHIAEAEVARMLTNLFKEKGIGGIAILHTPMK
jgi:hypothetical protein